MKEELLKIKEKANGDGTNELCDYASQQLADCREIYIASVDSDGFPRVCVISPLKTEGYGVIWFITSKTSEKIRHFLENPKASVCYGNGDDRQTLIGYVTIIDDQVFIHELWRDSLINWFPGGPSDSGICAVRFTASRAKLWHEGRTSTVIV